VNILVAVAPYKSKLHWIEIDADPVTLPAPWDKYEFFVHRGVTEDEPIKGWFVVSEKTTGYRVPNSDGSTRPQAVKYALAELEKRGFASFEQAMERLRKRGRIAPYPIQKKEEA